MGTSLHLPNNRIYIDGIDVKSYQGVQSYADTVNAELQKCEGALKQLIAATPKDICPADEDPIAYINESFDEIIREYREYLGISNSIELIENIVDMWKYPNSDAEDIYDSIDIAKSDSNSDCMKYVFCQKDEDNYNNPYTQASLFKKYTVTELNTVLNDIDTDFEKNCSSFGADTYYLLYYKDKLFTTDNGDYMFKSINAAKKAFYKKINLSNKLYYLSEPELIKTNAPVIDQIGHILKEISSEQYDSYINCINTLKSTDKYTTTFLDICQDLYDLMKMAIETKYLNPNIKFVKLSKNYEQTNMLDQENL